MTLTASAVKAIAGGVARRIACETSRASTRSARSRTRASATCALNGWSSTGMPREARPARTASASEPISALPSRTPSHATRGLPRTGKRPTASSETRNGWLPAAASRTAPTTSSSRKSSIAPRNASVTCMSSGCTGRSAFICGSTTEAFAATSAGRRTATNRRTHGGYGTATSGVEGAEAPCVDLEGGVRLVRDEQDEEREAEDEGDRAENRHAQALAVIDALARHIHKVAHA